jgi:hypothetical protein
MLNASVSYVLNENVAAGRVIWKNGYKNGEPLDTFAYRDMVLDGELLLEGEHEVFMPVGSLEVGATYTVAVSVTDSAGNLKEIMSDLVKLVSSIETIRIAPSDTTISLNDVLTFSAWGIPAGGMENETLGLDSVEWSVSGPGVINREGVFQAFGIGEIQITARSGDLSATVMLTVDHGSIIFKDTGENSLQIGKYMELIVSDMTDLQGAGLDVSLLEKGQVPPELKKTGPALALKDASDGKIWTRNEEVALRIRIDTAEIGGMEIEKVQVYRQEKDDELVWERMESERKAEWLTVVVDRLGAYMAAIDTMAPSLELACRTDESWAGSNVSLCYRASDNIANPRLFLRTHVGGMQKDSLIPLEYKKGEQIEVSLPKSLVSRRGLWYSMEIHDGATTIVSDTVDVKVKLREDLLMSKSVKMQEGGYQLFSVPMNSEKNTAEEMFYQDWGEPNPEKWRLFKYDNRFIEVKNSDPIVPGRAYWLQTRGFVPDITLVSGRAGTLPVSRSFSIPLNAGWNCIANPFLFNVSTGKVSDDKGKPVKHLYAYEDGEWKTGKQISSLQPWKGYLLWNGNKSSLLSDKVSLSPVEHVQLAKAGAAGSETQIGVRIASGQYRDGIAVIGFGYTGDDNDRLNLLKPPFYPKPLELSLVVEGGGGLPYLTDYRGDLGKGQSWLLRVKNQTGDRAVLEFSGLEALPGGIQAILLDESRAKVWELKKENVEYASKNSNEEVFTVLIGTPEYLESYVREFRNNTIAFSLEQNFPNPFAGQTTVRYTVPSPEGSKQPVRLQVFNSQGRLVAELVNGQQSSGAYTVQWNGTEMNGRPLPAGTYVYRIKVGERLHAARKMLLLR